MSVLRFLLGLAGCLVLAVQSQAAPLEAYGRLPSIEAVALSPSGDKVALVVTNGEMRAIAVQDLASRKVTFRVGAGSTKVRFIRWAGERHIIIGSSVTASPMDVITTQREWMMAHSVDTVTGKATQIPRPVSEQAMNTVHGIPVVRVFNGEPSVFLHGVTFVSNNGRITLFRVDLGRGETRLVQTGNQWTRRFLVGADGQPAAEELYEGRSGRWSMRLRSKDQGWREVVSITDPIDSPWMAGLGRDGNSVLYAAPDDTGEMAWKEVRPDGQTTDAPNGVEAQSPIWDPQDGRLIGFSGLVGDELRYTFFDPQDERVWKGVVGAFPGDIVSLVSWSADRGKIAVHVDSAKDGPAYAVVDLGTREATWLGAEYIGVKAADVSPRHPISFKAADGLELTAYLTLPRGREAKGLPLVVFPHGGPASRDTPGFDWWAQGMASRGYAVLQVNFRGSEGLGTDLLQAGYGEIGRKMQSDLSDGVRKLVADGTVDPKRVCIVGASYGGYAALAGATVDTGVYRCAVSVSGIADLRRMVAGSDAGFQRHWKRLMGVETLSDPVLAQISPALQASKAEIPILLIHGKDDSVVPLEQSRIMADALRKAGKPAELIVQKGEDHWLSRGDTRLETLTATVAFLEKHNPPH